MTQCQKCNDTVTTEAITADGKLWHPQCFLCFNCKAALDDKLFYVRKKAIFCTKCYFMMYKQRCTGCCKPVKTRGLKAMEVYWHQQCFQCMVCRVHLSNKYSVLKSNKQPYCLKCIAKTQSEGKRSFEAMLTSLAPPPITTDSPVKKSSPNNLNESTISENTTASQSSTTVSSATLTSGTSTTDKSEKTDKNESIRSPLSSGIKTSPSVQPSPPPLDNDKKVDLHSDVHTQRPKKATNPQDSSSLDFSNDKI